MTTLAVLSDIHGNRWALEAVLEDLERTSVDALINLGDSLWGVLDPAGTADLLIGLPFRNVRGNTDRAMLEDPAAHTSLGDVHSRAALTPERRRWLASHELPFVADGVLACHGTPGSDLEALLEDITERGVRRRSGAEVSTVLGDLAPDVSLVLCGHTHLPGIVQVPQGPLVVNPGSVGLQAYSHDVPAPHRMEAGAPHARWARLERRDGAWRVELRAVAYDWEAAARCADEVGREEWGYQLRTGHVRS